MPKTYEFDLTDYWRIIKRRKVIVMATFIFMTGAIWLHASRIPPTYEAKSTVKIEKPRTKGSLEELLVTTEEWDYIETQLEVITSREVAYEAASLAGKIKEGMPQDKIEEVLGQFQGVTTQRAGTTNIVNISAQSSNPEQTAFLVNTVAKGYQSWSLKERNQQAHQVRDFVEKRLKETEGKLLEKEDELKKFKENSPAGMSLSAFQQQLVTMELRLSDLLEKYTPKHPEVIELQGQINALKAKLGKYPELELEQGQLTRDVDNLKNIYLSLKQKYEDAKIAEAQTVSGVTVLDLATTPATPIAPNVRKSTSVGAVIALILGILLAFIKENVDTSISTIEEVEDFLQIPILGVIPEIIPPASSGKKWNFKDLLLQLLPFKTFQRTAGSDVTNIEEIRKMVLLAGEEHQFSSLEAYKTLRTNVNFAVAQKKGQVIEITSSGAREGKSLTALNLALTLAQNGQKTCLISADLRRETISRMLGVSKEPGLVDLLTKDLPWQDCIRKTTDLLVGELPPDRILQTMGVDNFHCLTAGKPPPNPAELLALEKMGGLLKELRQNFDFVVVDTPPILPVSDASILAPQTDGVILVYQVGRTARGALKRAKVQILSTGATILGVVLNNIKAAEMKMAPTYYYYREYYGPEDQLIRERKKRGGHKPWWQRLFSKAA